MSLCIKGPCAGLPEREDKETLLNVPQEKSNEEGGEEREEDEEGWRERERRRGGEGDIGGGGGEGERDWASEEGKQTLTQVCLEWGDWYFQLVVEIIKKLIFINQLVTKTEAE